MRVVYKVLLKRRCRNHTLVPDGFLRLLSKAKYQALCGLAVVGNHSNIYLLVFLISRHFSQLLFGGTVGLFAHGYWVLFLELFTLVLSS